MCVGIYKFGLHYDYALERNNMLGASIGNSRVASPDTDLVAVTRVFAGLRNATAHSIIRSVSSNFDSSPSQSSQS